ncbi:lamin tail domain-containing protein [bacterium AH-315-C07]|nr:lamin tail domain-containing protein [bacterium AH-315-C07]
MLSIPLLSHSQCPNCIVISEFAVDPDDGENGSPDETGEFIEIFNKCDTDVDISCYVLCMMTGNNGGECVTIPSGTTLPAGGVFLFGGFGTNCSDPDATATCDWSGLALDINWHNCGCVSDPDDPTLDGQANITGHYWGVLVDGGEDILLYNSSGTMIDSLTYEGGGGVTSGDWAGIYTTAALVGCAATTVNIPESATLPDIGNSPGGVFSDEGWQSNCSGTWTFTQQVDQTPGSPDCASLISCAACPTITPYILNVNDVTCNGDNDGSATASGSGGTDPYTFKWTNGDTTKTVLNLTISTYTVTITDAAGCDTTISVAITGPPPINAVTQDNGCVTCNGCLVNCNCKLWVISAGDTLPHAYSWNTGQTTTLIGRACSGSTYTVTVTDPTGCQIIKTHTVP